MHQLIQRDKPQPIVLDVDVLPALAAGLVRGIHIDGLNKLSQRIWVKLFNPYICLSSSLKRHGIGEWHAKAVSQCHARRDSRRRKVVQPLVRNEVTQNSPDFNRPGC